MLDKLIFDYTFIIVTGPRHRAYARIADGYDAYQALEMPEVANNAAEY